MAVKWCGTKEDVTNGIWGARVLLDHLSERKTLKSTVKRQILIEEENLKSYTLIPLGVLPGLLGALGQNQR